MKTLTLTLLIIVISALTIKSQTVVTFDTVSVNPLEICLGDCVELYSSFNTEDSIYVKLFNSFNDSTIGNGWYSANNPIFGNPCSSTGDNWDGSTVLWFGDETNYSRDLYSPYVSINSSSYLCFKLKFATQGEPSPCEGPDEMDEGVSLQWKTPVDNNWNTIKYFCPDGNLYSSNMWIGQSTAGGGTNTNFTVWNKYCFNLPFSTITDSTQFRWHQDLSTSEAYDHWGLDSIIIYSGDFNTSINWFYLDTNLIYSDTGSFQQCPVENTTYKAVLTNMFGSDSIYYNVFVSNLANDVSTSNISITPDTVNLGDTVFLYGLLNDTAIYTNDNIFLLLDGSSQDTTVTIDINSGGVINSASEINICMDVEHSYAGDLQIGIICPNGQEMMLFDGYGNSNIGGEFLGEPTDQSSNPGNPYTYCWSTIATNGTMEDVGANPPTYTYTDNDTNIVTDHEYIPGGTYESSGNWSSLIGCPYNGVWSLHIIDNLGIDDGYIFGWDINFNNWQLSTLWQGENTFYPTNDTSLAIPTTTGLHPYVYTLENALGCTYDTTLYVFVTDEVNIEDITNNSFKIYPNPAKKQITIESTETINKIEILDVTGKALVTHQGFQTLDVLRDVDITTLKKGIYFIKINDNKIVKFVKN